MPSATSPSITIGQLDCDIAEAELLINNRVQSLLVALRKGTDTMEAEARVRDMRRALELLYEQRRKLARETYLRSNGTKRSRPETRAS